MNYHYLFDDTRVGDFRLSRTDYLAVQKGYELLREELEAWNQRAVENGATSQPYEREVEDLSRMIEWGKEQLAGSRQDIVVNGMSVGSLRYAKAALMFTILKREQDRDEKANERWPSAALRSLGGVIEHLEKISGRIDCEPSDVLWEVIQKDVAASRAAATRTMEWDAFVSHASEDKEAFARPLAEGLQRCGLRVWFDEFTLTVGDSLRRSIDRGLARSRFGVVVVSRDFLRKEWPQKELDGLVARESDGMKVILPVWHGITADEIRTYSPTLADRLAASSDKGLDHVVRELVRAIRLDVASHKGSSPAQERSANGEGEAAARAVKSKTAVAEPSMAGEGVQLLKKYLVDDAHRIDLDDLLVRNTEEVHRRLTDAQFPVVGVPFRLPEIADRLREYESLTQALRSIVLTGCRWGETRHTSYWSRCLERIANPGVKHFGDGGWFNLRWYPALLILYAGGVASVAAPGSEALAALLSPRIKVRCSAGDLPLVRLVNTGMVLEDGYAVSLPGVKGYLGSKPTPFSQYLQVVLRDSFRDLIPEDPRYEACFDRFEIFLMLVHRHIVPDWPIALPGCFAWRNREAWDNIVQEARQAGEEWHPLRAGLFDGSLQRFTEAEAISRKMLWGSY